MAPQVILQNDFEDTLIPSLNQFQSWVEAVFEHVKDEIHTNPEEVCIRIVSRDESQALNEQFRQKEGPTNVLSFPNEADEFSDSSSLGDIAICANIVADEAEQLSIPNHDHWAHMTIHGVLHLLGYDHIDDGDAEIMEQLEISILSQLNIANPYQAEFNE